MAARRPAMVLPPHERSDGSVARGVLFSNDERIPRPLRTYADDYHNEDHPAQVLGYHVRPDECPDGRHLMDVIESTVQREIEPDADDGDWRTEIQFRARLTCVRCGLVQGWEGTRDGEVRGPALRLDPVPLVSGDLAAQQIRGGDYDVWAIYCAGVAVGSLTWSCGPRGRRFYVGRLDAWATGEHVEGPTPAAALAKVRKHADARAGRELEGVAR